MGHPLKSQKALITFTALFVCNNPYYPGSHYHLSVLFNFILPKKMTNLFLPDKVQTLNGEGFKVLFLSIDVPKILKTFFPNQNPKGATMIGLHILMGIKVRTSLRNETNSMAK